MHRYTERHRQSRQSAVFIELTRIASQTKRGRQDVTALRISFCFVCRVGVCMDVGAQFYRLSTLTDGM